ncbi:hypothetical protein PT285_05885 [Lactobacillus sp. ESL0791]|uniref:hypothetical protein n=1 Tax=Lactobacillus sp. ESL0791 TaxID=2983234 RepID=UPI0023F89EC0|nr:hypothetical protein [Lactobacillus sp. ESL0791]MDF7638928.1 hypothetical protein [Lactobacillus sp. ESL0791]
MLKRTNKIIIFLIIAYLLLEAGVVMAAIKDVSYTAPDGHKCIYLFFIVQIFGFREPMDMRLVKMILATIIGAGIFIYLKNNNSFINVQQRIGYRRFLKKGILTTFLSAASLSGLTCLYDFILISCLYHPFEFRVNDTGYLSNLLEWYFSPSDLQTILMFVLMSSLGWGVFALLVFSIGLFIRKTALYLPIGFIIGLVLLFVPLVLVGLAPSNLLARQLTFTTFLPSLLAPGIHNLNMLPPLNPALAFIFAVVIYTTAAAILITIWYKRKLRKG